MGLFDAFKRGRQATATTVAALPTVAAPANLADCYAAAFLDEMRSIGVLSDVEVRQALKLILEGDGGCLNQSRYFQAVFDTYFAGRTWRWPWYDEWARRFDTLGGRPSTWPVFCPREAPVLDTEVQRLPVAKLKEWLTEAGIAFPASAKGTALRELALCDEGNRTALSSSARWTKKLEIAAKKRGYEQYAMVMRTVLFRAIAQSDRARAVAAGIKQWQPMVVHKADQRFIDLALEVTPAPVGPLYPGDQTVWQVVLPDFDNDEKD